MPPKPPAAAAAPPRLLEFGCAEREDGLEPMVYTLRTDDEVAGRLGPRAPLPPARHRCAARSSPHRPPHRTLLSHAVLEATDFSPEHAFRARFTVDELREATLVALGTAPAGAGVLDWARAAFGARTVRWRAGAAPALVAAHEIDPGVWVELVLPPGPYGAMDQVLAPDLAVGVVRRVGGALLLVAGATAREARGGGEARAALRAARAAAAPGGGGAPALLPRAVAPPPAEPASAPAPKRTKPSEAAAAGAAGAPAAEHGAEPAEDEIDYTKPIIRRGRGRGRSRGRALGGR
jgi:hypothetical protein